MQRTKNDTFIELDGRLEELSPAQLAANEKVANEHNAIKNSPTTLMDTNEGKELFNGQVFSTYTITGKVLQETKEATVPKKPTPPATPLHQTERSKSPANLMCIEIESSGDEEGNIPLAKYVSTPNTVKCGQPPAKGGSQTPEQMLPKPPTRVTTPNSSPPTPSPASSKATKTTVAKASTATNSSLAKDKLTSQNFRQSEITSVGGLVINSKLKGCKAIVPENDGIMQWRTFPSLFMFAKPSMDVEDMSETRFRLDFKVKLVLMLAPNKFTEWLILEGLLKSEQKCNNHNLNELKLVLAQYWPLAWKIRRTEGYPMLFNQNSPEWAETKLCTVRRYTGSLLEPSASELLTQYEALIRARNTGSGIF